MKPNLDSTRTLARSATAPDLDALATELAAVLAQAGTVRQRQQAAVNTRLCRWDGQSDDYRKHESALGEAAKPFEGAPDLRVPVIDTVTRERVALYVEALMSAEVQAKPLGGLEEGERALKMSRVLAWLRDNKLQTEQRSEAELLANYVEGDDPGIGIVKVWWRRDLALEMRELGMHEIGIELLRLRGIELPEGQEPTPRIAQAIMDISETIYDLAREGEALEQFAAIFPTVERKLLRKALRELRRDGKTNLPLAFVKENRPCIAALRYMQDVFFPSDIDDIQRCRIIYEREWLTEPELRAKQFTETWGADFIADVLAAGPGGGEMDGYGMRQSNAWARQDGFTTRIGDEETGKLYEIWHAFSRSADGYGIPGVYWTVWSAKVRDSYGYHELLEYPGAMYPYVVFRSENIARGVENARGTPERGGSLQADIKRMRDSRGAHEMLSTLPPVRVAMRRGGLEAVLGPMVEVPVRQPDDVTWMNPPSFPAASMEMEKNAWNDLNQYFGRMVPGQPSELGQALLQNDVNRWLSGWNTVWGMIQELQQRYGDPVEMQLVTGGEPVTYTKEEIRGRYTTTIAFSVRDLNIEFAISRNQAIAAVLAQDMTGIVNRVPIIKAGLRAIDPALAASAIQESGAVRQKETEEEKAAVNMMANGIEPPLRQGGVNAQLRLQTMVQTIQGSPVLSRRVSQPQTEDDKYFAELVKNRQKNLQFLVDQYTSNPQIGRQGALALQGGSNG